MKSRNLVPELMDDPSIDPVEHRRALAGLRRVNAICQTGKHVANEIVRIAQSRKLKKVSVLDLGCGSGDIATNVASRLSGRMACDISGWDISPTAVASATEQLENRIRTGATVLPDDVSVTFHQADVFEPTNQKFDIVYCCLFLHHFSDEQSVQLLKRMKEIANIAVIVDDLQRTSLGLALAKLGCYLLSRSPVVHFDGPQSVRAAFRIDEVLEMAAMAGMHGCSIHKHWPERFLLRWDATS